MTPFEQGYHTFMKHAGLTKHAKTRVQQLYEAAIMTGDGLSPDALRTLERAKMVKEPLMSGADVTARRGRRGPGTREHMSKEWFQDTSAGRLERMRDQAHDMTGGDYSDITGRPFEEGARFFLDSYRRNPAMMGPGGFASGVRGGRELLP